MESPADSKLEAIRVATFSVEEREKVTDNDTAAFVDVLVGSAGFWIRHGLTSSDVRDIGLSLHAATGDSAGGGDCGGPRPDAAQPPADLRALFSQRVLLALVEQGATWDEADRTVQSLASGP